MSLIKVLLAVFLFLSFNACRDDIAEDVDNEELILDYSDYPDWAEETHSNTYDPNYSIVFNQEEVLRFDITINSTDWSTMQSDLSDLLGSSGGGPGGGPGGGNTSSFDEDPIWVECTFKFNNTEWYNVGIRYKGNSSLRSAYQSGNNKLSFKLDFDEFENDYPELNNQRFYGFKQLNLNNNFDDASLMREKVGADMFRSFGLASAQTTFCVVYVDSGNGPQYYGVYTLVEEVDDSVLDSQFSNGYGNLYKPDGNAASFAQGTYNEGELEKKTNEDLSDYSDTRALYDVINSSERTTNKEQWKSNLEAVLNVDAFLKWLAANTTIQNWDTYGNMTHNFYLYNNPEDSLLTWIPWDNNEAFQYGKQGGALTFTMGEVNASWPLIRYIIDIEEYKAIYKKYLSQFITEVFIPSNMILLYEKYNEQLKEYAYAEEAGYTFIYNNSDFDNAVAYLKKHVDDRNLAVISYLN